MFKGWLSGLTFGDKILERPQPQYGAPQPSYLSPQQVYFSTQPSYSAPQPSYLAPQPSFSKKKDMKNKKTKKNKVPAKQAVYQGDATPSPSESEQMMSNMDMLRMSVPGEPGRDYPILDKKQKTSLSCQGLTDGGKIDDYFQTPHNTYGASLHFKMSVCLCGH